MRSKQFKIDFIPHNQELIFRIADPTNQEKYYDIRISKDQIEATGDEQIFEDFQKSVGISLWLFLKQEYAKPINNF